MKRKSSDFTTDNFSFSAGNIVGSFLQTCKSEIDTEFFRMTDGEVNESLKLFPKESLNVEQRSKSEPQQQQQILKESEKIEDELKTKKVREHNLRIVFKYSP